MASTWSDNGAELALKRMRARMSAPSLAAWMRGTVSPYLAKQAEARFDTGGDEAVGGPWAPLSPVTVAIRESMGFTPGTAPGEINVRTGTLREWMTSPRADIAGDPLGVVMSWPSTPRPYLKRRLDQSAGKVRGGLARHVLGYDAGDVAHIVGSLRVMLEGGRP